MTILLTKVIYDNEDNVWRLSGEDDVLGEEEEQGEGDEGHGGLGLEVHGGSRLEEPGTDPAHTLHHLHHFRERY